MRLNTDLFQQRKSYHWAIFTVAAGVLYEVRPFGRFDFDLLRERGGDGHDVWPTVNPHQRTSPVRLDTAAPFVIDVRDKNPAGEKQHV